MATIALASTVLTRQVHTSLWVAQKTVTLADGDEDAADIIEMVRVPRGAYVVDVICAADDLDTNATPTIAFTVGDQGDTDRFITSSTIAQTGGVARLNATAGADFTYTADDTIDITFGTAAATFAAGDITLKVLLSMNI